MYSTVQTTSNCVTTNSTTRVFDYCEVCEQDGPNVYHGIFHYGLDSTIISLKCSVHSNWYCLCDKHKTEYDIKLKMKLRKSKLEKINEYNGSNMGS